MDYVKTWPSVGPVEALVIFVLWLLFFFTPIWLIVRKAGYSGAWSLLLFIPVVNLIALWLFALLTWPVQRRARAGI